MKLKEVFRIKAETYPPHSLMYKGVEHRKEFDHYPNEGDILEWVEKINLQVKNPDDKINETSRISVNKFFKLH